MALFTVMKNGQLKCCSCGHWFERDTGHDFYKCRKET